MVSSCTLYTGQLCTVSVCLCVLLQYAITPPPPSHTLGSMVTTMRWNDQANILATLQDGKFSVWYHPAVVYTDQDLLRKTQLQKEGRWVW